MALDIYCGTLTRYYMHDWETADQQWARANGVALPLGRPGDDEHPPLDQVVAGMEAWRDALADYLHDEFGCELYWEENNDTAYFTDKPDWDGYGAVLLWALCTEQGIAPPDLLQPGWDYTEDGVYQQFLNAPYDTAYPALLCDAQLFLPADADFLLQAEDPCGNESIVTSSFSLLRDLQRLNERTWRADRATIAEWAGQGFPGGQTYTVRGGKPYLVQDERQPSLEQAAQFGFGVLYALAEYATSHHVPMLFDY